MVIDNKTKKEEVLHLVRNSCKRCGHCCSLGSGIVLKEEVEGLAKSLGISREKLLTQCLDEFTKFNTAHYRFKQIKTKYPHGRCVFHDQTTKECRIHDKKPLHCKVSTCSQLGSEVQKWFDVTYFYNKKDRNSVAEYKIYSEFNGPLTGALPEEIKNRPKQ